MKINTPLTPMYRVYRKGKPYKHLGNVEAHSPEEARKKAVGGHWKGFFADISDQPTEADNLEVFS